jgi:hypothetical protein
MIAASTEEPALPRPLLCACNRGIVVAVVYATVIAVLFEELVVRGARPSSGLEPLVLGALGVVAGAIGGFSNTLEGESRRRDRQRNAVDGLVIVLWVSVLLLALNLGLRFAVSPRVFTLIGAFAAGTMIGALIGEALLGAFVGISIKGRRPLLWVNAVTARIDHPDVRFVVRVVVQTITVGLLVTLAVVTAIAIIALVALALAFLIMGKAMGAASGPGPSYPDPPAPNPWPEPEPAPRDDKHPQPLDLLAGIRDGSFHGSIDPDGLVKDAHGNLVASVDRDGLIHERDRSLGWKGEYLGRVDGHGLVKDRGGNIVGSIDGNGLVKDAARDVVIGKVNRE